MGKVLEKDNLRMEMNPKGMTIDTLFVSPGEAHRLMSCLNWVSKLQDVKVLPPSVSHEPFTVSFKSDGAHVLSRTGAKGSVTFRFSQLDPLMDLINSGVAIHKDQLEVRKLDTLRRGPRGTGIAGGNNPDIIDGN